MGDELRIELADEDADEERMDTLTRNFQRELRQLDDVDSVKTASSSTPPGSKGLDAATVEALLVAVGTGAQGLAAVVVMAQEWRRRGREKHRKVRLEVDGDVLVLEGEPGSGEDRLVVEFLEAHARRKSRR
jgi:hypothetical protein